MTDKPKVLCFAGSLRKDSFNKKLVKQALEFAKEAGAEATYVDLKEYPLPIYDGDIESESGLPENAIKLKKLFKENDAFLIASPEYNSTISAALKNVIDWVSRPEPNEKPLVCFTGKVAGVMAASPGALGGMRGLVALRTLLGNIGVIVATEQHTQSKAGEAFDAEGKLTDEKAKLALDKIAKRVVAITRGLKSVQ